jgi:hypothetical protein
MSPNQGFYMQISHHWFATLFSMISAWAALACIGRQQRWLRDPLFAGLVAGAMVTPTRGAAAALAAATAYLDPRRYLAEAATFALGCVVVPLCLLVYLLTQSALPTAYQDVIVFPAQHYLPLRAYFMEPGRIVPMPC